jgi:hypothetical protein
MATSFPFLALARDLGVPYAVVSVWAAWLDKSSFEMNDFERRVYETLTAEQGSAIAIAVIAERDRRYAVQKEIA